MTSAVTALASRCDVVVVDLGRARSDSVESLLPLTSLVVLVVPARVRGVAAARRLLPILAPASERLHVAVRMPSPGGLDPADIQAALGLPSLGEVPHDASPSRTRGERSATSSDRGVATAGRSSSRSVRDCG